MLILQKNQLKHCLSSFNAFKIRARARSLFALTDVNDLLEALQTTLNTDEKPPVLLGGGSNVLFLADYDGLVLINQIQGIHVVEETQSSVNVSVGSGVNWHALVEWANQQGYYGLENLSLIPGSVGAAPVQNIGAYGVEVSSVLIGVDAVHRQTLNASYFDVSACQLGYRDSFFKSEQGHSWLITDVHFRLSKQPTFRLHYAGLTDLQEQADAGVLTGQQVSDTVNKLRQSKLPDPLHLPNAGSFFKNPMVTHDELERLQQAHDDLVFFQMGDQWKLSAAWLIEKMGWKAYRRGDAGVYEKHSLVLVNYGDATGSEIWALATDIINSVQQNFGIRLEAEVRLID